MKQIFYKISSLLIAIVVLLSTMSYTINSHYCGGILVDSAIFTKVGTCGMEMENRSTEGCSITKKDCCNDEQISFDGQDELQLSFNTLAFNQQIFVASFVYSYINLFEGLKETISLYRDYAPPLVVRQIYKIDETYLI
ncbi:HYC_CC_PP family protein [Maribacter cobaltidurans]|uniref:Uncharacterized protein n=1 Tax=Maribacter cobaltidurans TaxID=1178778 RepID=A0A223V2G2_9FLAO|nr:hypothetical protein [Maribacter cobaltidurans]ASV29585.1 hypothetical protein CJ263_04800 [Maribacter cobaltidurans]GGD67730.1 hypothetical protein GCM10011412_01570 [Maribacter cobaltidurans]|tara:strand:+ start:664 stop:1077 length:414 start_codon:yes stop_codon:yes gene_type:complete